MSDLVVELQKILDGSTIKIISSGNSKPIKIVSLVEEKTDNEGRKTIEKIISVGDHFFEVEFTDGTKGFIGDEIHSFSTKLIQPTKVGVYNFSETLGIKR